MEEEQSFPLNKIISNGEELIPSPPTESKSSKFRSRLPIPSKNRSKSENSAIIYG